MQRKVTLIFLCILTMASCKINQDLQDSEISSPSQEEINTLILEENRKGFVITTENLPNELPNLVIEQVESSVVTNSNKTLEAFTFCNDSCQIFYRTVGEEAANKIYAPYFFRGRSFENIRWADTYILEFDQSSQPNHATSYSVNVQTRELENVRSLFSPSIPQEP